MSNSEFSILLGGDVMLGRLVKEIIQQQGPHYPLGQIAHILQKSDLTMVNLECAITQSKQQWSGYPKAFYFGAPPIAAQILQDCKIDIVTLANNHILDFDYKGLSIHSFIWIKKRFYTPARVKIAQ